MSEPKQEPCDRAEIVCARMECFLVDLKQRAILKANIRIALDIEVEAGGPYINNGWNRRALSPPEPTEWQVEAMAKAAFEIDWPKDDWSRFKPGDYVPERYRKIVRAALRAMPLQDHGSPMETAPKNGEVLIQVERRAGIPNCFLVGHYQPGGHCIDDHPAIDEGWYFWNGCMFDRAAKPLRWWPLPAMVAEERGAK